VEAEILTTGITTPLLKYAVGRVRPSDGSDADEFKPFSGNSSFPSGETTEAFAVASVLSARADGWVVPVVSYTLASCVGYARVHDRGHWAKVSIRGLARLLEEFWRHHQWEGVRRRELGMCDSSTSSGFRGTGAHSIAAFLPFRGVTTAWERTRVASSETRC